MFEKLTSFKFVKKFLALCGTRGFITALCGTRGFITAFTSGRHPSLFWISSIQSVSPHPTSWRSVLILTSHIRLAVPRVLFPSGFSTRILCKPVFFPIRATCPAYFTQRTTSTNTSILLAKCIWFIYILLCEFEHLLVNINYHKNNARNVYYQNTWKKLVFLHCNLN